MNYRTGKKKIYHWIEFGSSDFDLDDLINHFSDLIIGKYVGVVCFDGLVFTPSKEELSRGWCKEDLKEELVQTAAMCIRILKSL